MYRAIMRNDFATASLHADSALAADDQLALAYLAKMIEAAWITGSADDYRAAYNTATELVAEDDYAAKYTIEAMGLSGDERIAAAGKALMHNPDDPLLIAWTAFWLGDDTDQSIQMIKRGMERWPYMAAFHNLMGYRLMQRKTWKVPWPTSNSKPASSPTPPTHGTLWATTTSRLATRRKRARRSRRPSKSILRLTPPSASLRNSTAPTPIPDS